MSRRPVGSALRSRMHLSDDNATIVNHIPSSMHTDILSLLRRIEPDDDCVEEDNLTWSAAGLESLRSDVGPRGGAGLRPYAQTGGNGHRRHPRFEFEMTETIADYQQYRENITSTDEVVIACGVNNQVHN